MLGSRSTTLARTVLTTQRRNAGGFLRKNIRIEENAGIRESSYKTWKFDGMNFVKLTLGLFLPGYMFYQVTVDENARKDQQVGNTERKYGILFEINK